MSALIEADAPLGGPGPVERQDPPADRRIA